MPANASDLRSQLAPTVGVARTLAPMRMRGYCNRTFFGQPGDCEFGDKGAHEVDWNSSVPGTLGQRHAMEPILQCREHCLSCERCRYYSYSLRWRDCSWFHDCDVSALHRDILGFWTSKVEEHERNATGVKKRDATRQKRLAPALPPSPDDAFLALLPNFTTPDAGRRPRPPSPPAPAQSPCFAPNVRGAYLEGEWRFQAGSQPPYQISRSFWPLWQKSNVHYYGLCREVLPSPSGEYVWQTRGCQLRSLSESVERSCELLRGRRIAISGDSTVLQFFQSLTFVLNGSVAAWSNGGNRPLGLTDRDDPRRIVSFLCGGSVRLDFFRNDYMLYSRTDDRASAKAGAFQTTRPFTDFTAGMHHADLIVLGAGMHYFDNKASAGLYTRVMNYTLASVQRHRHLLHGHQRRTTFVLSPPKPTTNCFNYERPINLGEALEADLNEGKFMHQYQELRRYHEIAAWAAASNEASFIDSFSLGARRPDAAMASVARGYELDPNLTLKRAFPLKSVYTSKDVKSVSSKDDCVHFCLPGPTDTYVRLLLGMLLDFEAEAPLFLRPAATSWHDQERRSKEEHRQSAQLHIPPMSSLDWWPLRPPPAPPAPPTPPKRRAIRSTAVGNISTAQGRMMSRGRGSQAYGRGSSGQQSAKA